MARDSLAIVWFRLDLRLADNPALRAALDHHERVIPLYVHAPGEEAPWQPGAASRWWLHGSLAALDESLRGRGSRLVIRHGPALEALRALIRETGAGAVYWNRRYEPAVIARDREVMAALREHGIAAESFNGVLAFEPWEVMREGSKPYRVFTPFWRACQATGEPQRPGGTPRKLNPPGKWPRGEPLDSLALLPRVDWAGGLRDTWQPGEAGARERLNRFARGRLSGYAHGRDLPGEEGVSRLSPHLHFGEVSARQVWHRCSEAPGNAEPFLRQLAWRDFAHHLLYHFPHTPGEPFREAFTDFPWRSRNGKEEVFAAWCAGRTGVPMVDAGMRELWHSGWMHNRLRMVVASFLAKNGLVHWLEGARWFWDTLVDADLASNTLGWQWTAGCGADAAPFFRIFNPARQGRRFDPDGSYVRRWCPELAALPDAHLHAPWQAPADVLREAGIEPGREYPQPVLDLDRSRREALEAFRRLG